MRRNSRIALHRDELAGVDGHVLRELTPGDEVLAARKGLRHVQPVDVTSEHERARRRDGPALPRARRWWAV